MGILGSLTTHAGTRAGRSSTESCLPTIPQCRGAGQLSKPGKAMGLQPSTTTGLHPGLLFLGHVESSCTRTLLPKLHPHAQKQVWQKLWGKKIPSSSQNIIHALQWASPANLQLRGHRFGRAGVKLSSKCTQFASYFTAAGCLLSLSLKALSLPRTLSLFRWGPGGPQGS